ncbi:uncharacterized protein isoform X5 [Danio rerio]|uniref:Uncharacterized protein isoform X5 n=1 Tax=Danio rerio TaxID=7955 RepID=A0AC58GBK2_DANRE
MYGIVRKYIGVILDTVKELMDMRGYKHMACGVRCVLSPRPSNCSTSSPHKDEKDRPHSTSARGQQLSRDCAKTESELKVLETYVGIKRTEKRERARSSVYRQRVPLDLTPRPSTAPLGMGRRAPETPMCEIIWRRKDDYKETSQHCTEDLSLTPTLHLYLPSSYQPHEQGEDGGAVEDNRSLGSNNQEGISGLLSLRMWSLFMTFGHLKPRTFKATQRSKTPWWISRSMTSPWRAKNKT